MKRFWGVLALLVIGLGRVRAQDALAAPQIFLVTMGVGETIDARFGHNALWVHDTVRHEDSVYNFGTYDFDDPNFILHFIKGRPVYWLSTWSPQQTLAVYRHLERSVVVQELDLPAAKRAELAFLLSQNASPGQREYRYDYYLDNCSTRVRDLLDQVLGGALRRVTVGQPADGTLRFHTQRSITNNPFLYLGIMALMGPSTDRPLDRWDEMFLPVKLQERVRELRITGDDGREVPLVKNEQTLVAMDVHRAEATPPAWGFPLLLIGMGFGLVMLTGLRQGGQGIVGRVATWSWLIASGLGGLLLLFVWVGTNHVAAADNRNLLLLSPFALPVVRLMRGPVMPQASRNRRFFWYVFAGSTAVGTLLAVIPALGLQWNLQLAALVVPANLAALCVTARRPAAAPPSLR